MRLSKKIFRSILLVSSVILFAGVMLIMCVLYGHFSTQKQIELQSELTYIKVAVEHEGIDYLKSLSDKTKRLTYIKADGTVVFDNTTDVATMGNHLERKEVKSALESGVGESKRYSETLLEQHYYYALKLDNGDILRISATENSVLMMIVGMLQPFAFVIIVMIILSAVFASRSAKKIVAPINEINIENPLENDTYEEISPLLNKISKQNKTIARQLKNAKRKQEEFELITENMSEGILVLDKYANLLSVNSAAMGLLSSSRDKKAKSVVEINRSVDFLDTVEAAVSGIYSERKLKSKGRILNLIASPVVFDEKPAGVVMIVMDVTEKAQREELRREFTANVSHELKTPLTSISGFAELLKSGTVDKKNVVDFSTSIYDEAGRLIRLVNDIIKISKLDENSVPFDDSPVDIAEIVKLTAERIQPIANKNDITIDYDDTKACVKGNYSIVEEMIFNLVDNAVKYNKKGGKVKISVENQEKSVKISVSDTGIGIEKADFDKIFERFYRVDKSHSKEIGGTGLGLSIVKHGAVYHNAQVDVQSEIGKGTTISITFNK